MDGHQLLAFAMLSDTNPLITIIAVMLWSALAKIYERVSDYITPHAIARRHLLASMDNQGYGLAFIAGGEKNNLAVATVNSKSAKNRLEKGFREIR